MERPDETVPGVGAVGRTGDEPSEPTAAVAPQVTEEKTEEVPAPDASVEEQLGWFRAAVQKFEESGMGVVWKQWR